MDYKNSGSYRKYISKSQWFADPKKQTYLELLLTFAATIFFTLFALRPTLTTISQLIKDRDTLKQVTAELDQKITALVAAQELYQEAEPKLRLLDQALPADQKLADFTAQMEVLALESNAVLKSLVFNEHPLDPAEAASKSAALKRQPAAQTNPNQTPQSWSSIGFSLRATGEFQNLRELAVAMTHLRRLVQVDSLSIRKPQGVAVEEPLELELVGSIAYY